ncbi:MAG: hypothetical protein NZ554_14070, partial [Bryobacteraceae bacterium]|nr:hypothetical protein [Bryobacteraceae bacterium]
EGGIKRWLGIPQKYYSEQERPLKWRDCLEYRSWFAHMEMYPYCLIGRLRRVIPWLGRRAVRRLDHQILTRLPWLRHWASGLLICIEA